MTAPMHKHRPRSNDTSLKMRIASSESLRKRQTGGIKITMKKAPWDKKEKPTCMKQSPQSE